MCNLLYRWRSCCRIELDNDTCPHTHAPLIHLARDSYSFDIVHWNHGNKTDIGINWKDFNLKFIETTKLISFTNRLSTAFFSQGKKNLLSFLFILFIAKFVVLHYTFCNFEGIFGFFCSVNHLSGGGLMQITMQQACPAWSTKTKLTMTLDCSRIAKEIAMVSGSFVEGRMQTLLYSCKWQKSERSQRSEKSSKQTSRLLPETGRSQATKL